MTRPKSDRAQSVLHRYDATRIRSIDGAYRIERQLDGLWFHVSSTSTVDAALRFLRGKDEWTARVVRARDGKVVHVQGAPHV